MPIDVPIEERILILAPQGRDADVILQTLSQHGLNCRICGGYTELIQQLQIGAGAALITEEGFNGADFSLLDQWLEKQESWSDFPFVILSARQAGQNR